jgi:type VI secretion system protein VasD
MRLVFALVVTVPCACAKAPPSPPTPPAITIAAPPTAKVKASMTLLTQADANPDTSGRPSPVVVRVYQLRTDAAFSTADFFALYDDDQRVLGQELISKDEFVMAPSERLTRAITLAEETRFVGAIAAFRDIRNAQWRALLPAPREGLLVSVERARITLSLAE